jgi:hypothetical protein
MSLRQPWFLVMAPKAGDRFGRHWAGYDTPPRGDVLSRLVTPENRRPLMVCVFVWLAAALLIWLWGFRSGMFSLAFAVMATVLVAGVVVASFVRLVCVRMTLPEPQDRQSR